MPQALYWIATLGFSKVQPLELHVHPLLVRLIYTNNFTCVTHHLLIALKHVEKELLNIFYGYIQKGWKTWSVL